jgi:hypothetical protein
MGADTRRRVDWLTTVAFRLRARAARDRAEPLARVALLRGRLRRDLRCPVLRMTRPIDMESEIGI